MERGSDKHSARMDDAMEAEVRGMITAGRETRAEDWNSAEPSGEDQPDVDLVPDGTLAGGVPEGMTEADVELRSEIASYLGKECWPCDAEQLLFKAAEMNAPENVLNRLRDLPAGRSYENMQDVWSALHGGVEAHRF
ncbi:MAG: hypothetical protein QOE05_1365 [Actinomycetota bacterium]|jgi:hypothetical protein|nr:hypothetical protein [Actinomycetota bacterium]